jgi:hypothetical protein
MPAGLLPHGAFLLRRATANLAQFQKIFRAGKPNGFPGV